MQGFSLAAIQMYAHANDVEICVALCSHLFDAAVCFDMHDLKREGGINLGSLYNAIDALARYARPALAISSPHRFGQDL